LFELISKSRRKTQEELLDIPTSSIRDGFDDVATGKVSPSEKEKIIKALKFTKERAVKLDDLVASSEIYLDGFTKKLDEQDLEIVKNNSAILKDLKEVILAIENWTHDGIKDAINDFAVLKNLKFKDFGKPLRIALAFSSSSAGGIFDVLEILGKEESLKRIDFNL
jgi:glutamyl/glutaminyl-tRNA synthetase